MPVERAGGSRPSRGTPVCLFTPVHAGVDVRVGGPGPATPSVAWPESHLLISPPPQRSLAQPEEEPGVLSRFVCVTGVGSLSNCDNEEDRGANSFSLYWIYQFFTASGP